MRNNPLLLLKNLKTIDYLVIAIVLLFILVISLFLFRKSEMIPIRVRVSYPSFLFLPSNAEGSNPTNYYLQAFKVGAQERDGLGRSTAEITKVTTVPISKDTSVVYLDMLVKAVYDSRTKTYALKGDRLTFGLPLHFVLDSISFDGVVTDVKNFSVYEMGETTVEAKVLWESRNFSDTYGVLPYIAEGVSVGQKVTSSDGIVYAEVLSIEKKPAKRVVFNPNGGAIIINDPVLIDVTLKIKLRTKKIGDKVYIFEDTPLLIDQNIPLNLPNISLYPTITKLLP